MRHCDTPIWFFPVAKVAKARYVNVCLKKLETLGRRSLRDRLSAEPEAGAQVGAGVDQISAAAGACPQEGDGQLEEHGGHRGQPPPGDGVEDEGAHVEVSRRRGCGRRQVCPRRRRRASGGGGPRGGGGGGGEPKGAGPSPSPARNSRY